MNNEDLSLDIKSIYGENIDDRIIEDFAKISAIDFTYKPEYQNEAGADSEEHTGVIAQELEQLKSTEGTVIEGEDGIKKVNTGQLALTDTAAIAELSRRVLALEEVVRELQKV